MAVERRFKLVADTKDAEKNIKKVKKDVKEVKTSTLDAADSFGAFGVTVGSVRSMFKGVTKTAKLMFGSIKAGLISTGIGAFVVALGTMAQYFRDNEEGASKFREITSQIGVVIGNVTDIISDFGGALVKLLSRDLQGFKDGLNDAIEGVKNFGETTKEEMEMAKKLEKERAELIIFERDANVSKAKSEAEIMKLRMQARDEEKFTNEQRLEFMRQANKLADEQLQKDLHIAEKKLEFQQIENSYSKSSTENLNAEAELEAQLFNIQRSNFSERKRMKSEEQAIVKRIAAENDKNQKAETKRMELEQRAKELGLEFDENIATAEIDLLVKTEEKKLELAKKTEETETAAFQQGLEELRKKALTKEELEIQTAQDKYNKLLAIAEQYGLDTVELTTRFEEEVKGIQDRYDNEEELKAQEKSDKQFEMANSRIDQAQQIMGALSQIAQETLNAEKNELQRQLDAGLISQEEFDKETAKIEEEAVKREKRNAVLQILIDTAQGIAGAIKAGAGLVFPANLGAILAGVSSVVGGIASAKAILNQVPGDSGGGGEENVNAQSNMNIPAGGGLSNLIPNADFGNGSQPVQAYVVENDISNAQALSQELNDQATL
jgi:hypothetical protein